MLKEKEQLEKIIKLLKNSYEILNDESCKNLQLLKKIAEDKRQIATEAIQQNNELSKLDGVGSKTWRALWEAARQYSITEAYKSEDFPKTDGAKCVLCHQDLDEEAQKRLLNFEKFVKSTLEKDALTAEKALKDAIEMLPAKPTAESIEESLQLAGLDIDEWKTKIEEEWNTIAAKSDKIKNVTSTEEIKGLSISTVISELENISMEKETIAKQFEKDAKEFDRKKAKNDLLELEAKEWASSQKDAILSEFERVKKIKQYDNWKTFVSTRGISTKASEISKMIITNEYIRRFNYELEMLGAKKIKVKLEKTRVREGVVNHKVKLQDSVTSVPIVDVLSEGEQRIIALAAFLADVTGKVESTPFIFDDPISSLDQDFEEKTIERLVQLAENRQVIVFTHRLSFLGIINDKANALEQVHIRTEPWGSGEVGEIPLFAKKPDKALKSLQNERLVRAKKIYLQRGSEEYYPLAKAICSDFRILLERIVEFYLLADVVQRHRRAINTMGKIEKLAKVTSKDCELIDAYMTKYSVYEHSQSSELPSEIPTPEELDSDINKILSWYEEFKSRI